MVNSRKEWEEDTQNLGLITADAIVERILKGVEDERRKQGI